MSKRGPSFVPGVLFLSLLQSGCAASTDAHSVDRVEPDQPAITIDAKARHTVCYVEDNASASSPHFQEALTKEGIEVEVRAASAFPQTLSEMSLFGVIVVSNVRASSISVGQMEALERYVRELGGGLIMSGGPNAFGMGGYEGTPIEGMLPVHLGLEESEHSTAALALVIDKSGAMLGAPIKMAQKAARAATQALRPDDFFEVIFFDTQPTTSVPLSKARHGEKVLSKLPQIAAGGGSSIFGALDVAYRDLSAARTRTKHVIVLVHGHGSTEGVSELVQVMAAEGITLSTVSLGEGTDRPFLKSIADQAGGRFSHTEDPHDIPLIFAQETRQACRSLIVEEFFQPQLAPQSPMLRDIPMGSAPYLRGYVATKMRPPPAELILSSDLGQPLLARTKVGVGQTLAWTSDLGEQWAVDWRDWSLYATFWAQVVRAVMPQGDEPAVPPPPPVLVTSKVDDPPVWVLVKSGTFLMGSIDSELGRHADEKQHKVTLTRDFHLQETEVTQEQWWRLMKNNPSFFRKCGGDCPVDTVTWHETLEYCNAMSRQEKLQQCYTLSDCNGKSVGEGKVCAKVGFVGMECRGYRLPSEAEWEYAARAGTKTSTYNGDLASDHLMCEDGDSALDPIGWFCANSHVTYGGVDCQSPQVGIECGTHPGGKKQPNPWGLHDMLGNVSEWVWDAYDAGPHRPATGPNTSEASSKRVIRGGNWISPAGSCRAATRWATLPSGRGELVGFRVAKSL